MIMPTFYALVGAGLVCLGLYALIGQAHLLRKILAINMMGSGVFLVLVGLGHRDGMADPIAHAMVITGIVVAVSATALALSLMVKMSTETGQAELTNEYKE